MSGGVDSAVAALLLLREGYAVEGLTMRLLDPAVFPHADDTAELRDARTVCEALGIPHTTLDLRDKFPAYVAEPFARAYREGLTPNPCLICNRRVKFGLLLDYALSRGFDALATGHYARLSRDEEGFCLHRARELRKDQSYVLYGIQASALPHILLPLGEYGKEEVRAFAADAALPVANRPDSQDICFVRKESYGAFIRRLLGDTSPGEIVDEEGTVRGRHTGLDDYTIGQRKGIGGFGEPRYVLSKNAANNTLTVGKNDALYHDCVYAGQTNWHRPPARRFRAFCKLRYTHEGGMALAETDGDTLKLTFDKPQRAPAAGQAAVLYDGDRLLGGGIIM